MLHQTKGLKTGVIRLAHHKAFGGREGGIHLRVPDKTGNGKRYPLNGDGIPQIHRPVLFVENGGVQLPVGGSDGHIVKIKKKIKLLALRTKSIVLQRSGERFPVDTDVVIFNVEKPDDLKL